MLNKENIEINYDIMNIKYIVFCDIKFKVLNFLIFFK